jgi:hypothetical protein
LGRQGQDSGEGAEDFYTKFTVLGYQPDLIDQRADDSEPSSLVAGSARASCSAATFSR